jgi:hypothetical protein
MHDRGPTPKRIACVHRAAGGPSRGPRATDRSRPPPPATGIVVDESSGPRATSRTALARGRGRVRAAVDHVPSARSILSRSM